MLENLIKRAGTNVTALSMFLYSFMLIFLSETSDWSEWFLPITFLIAFLLLKDLYDLDLLGHTDTADIHKVSFSATVRLILLLALLVVQGYSGWIHVYGSAEISLGYVFDIPKTHLYSWVSLWWAWNNERAIRAYAGLERRGRKEFGILVFSTLVTAAEAVLFTYEFGFSHIFYGFLACVVPVCYGCYLLLPEEKPVRVLSVLYAMGGLLAADFLLNSDGHFGTDRVVIRERLKLIFGDVRLLVTVSCFTVFFSCILLMNRGSRDCMREHEAFFTFVKATLVFRMAMALLYFFGFWHMVRIPFLDETFYEETILYIVFLMGDHQAIKLHKLRDTCLVPASGMIPLASGGVRIQEEEDDFELDDVLGSGPWDYETMFFNETSGNWEELYEMDWVQPDGYGHMGIFKTDPEESETFILRKEDLPGQEDGGRRFEVWKEAASEEASVAVRMYLMEHRPFFADERSYTKYFEEKWDPYGDGEPDPEEDEDDE